MRRRVPGLLLLGLTGCMPGTNQTAMVPSNPFAGPLPTQTNQITQTTASPATEEASLRVLNVGQKVVKANPQLELRPFFSTIGATASGSPAAEIFHTGGNQLVITEPLVRQCQTDGQLAALLCVELAKMVNEREQSAAQWNDTGPPVDVPIGGDARGTFGPADGTRAAELAKYDRSHHRGVHATPDPKERARTYLTKAGFQATDLDAAAPILRAAESNFALEKQMKK
jgi:hypothetical protein